VAPPDFSPTPSEPFTAARRPGAAGGRASESGGSQTSREGRGSGPAADVEGLPEDVRLAAGGDRRAFERLYAAHVDRIHTLCVRMCADRSTAEELTQDVFVRAWDKLSLFRGESAFGTWLHRMAVNVVLNHRKVAGRERSRSAADDAVDVVASRPLQLGDRMDLEQAVAQLPPGARRVFLLHDVEGYKHEEIAAMLGVTSGGTKAQLHRARMLLREALQR
jgi:RNA polymerase sigma-70 factor, ECF subfamily